MPFCGIGCTARRFVLIDHILGCGNWVRPYGLRAYGVGPKASPPATEAVLWRPRK